MIDISMLSSQYDVRRLADSDADDILDLCRKNTLYYQYCGAETSRKQVINDLHVTPPGVDPSEKYYVGYFQKGIDEIAGKSSQKMIAIMDLIDGYPEPDIGYIGFFMMDADLQGKEIGSGIIQDTCAYLKRTGKKAIRLGIARDNPQANHFWKKNGFRIIKEIEQVGWTVLVAESSLIVKNLFLLYSVCRHVKH